MTKTETIIYSVFVVSVPLPFIILLILNIIHPENLSSLLFFRMMTIVCLVFELTLIPFLEIILVLDGLFLSVLASIISIVLLWWGAGWKNFWGLYCFSEHSGWNPFLFYFLLALPWLIRLKVLFDSRDELSFLFSSAASSIGEEILSVKKNDQLLEETAKTDESYFVRQKAVRQLNDPEALSEIIKNDPSLDVRKEAIERYKAVNQDDPDENTAAAMDLIGKVIECERKLELDHHDIQAAEMLRDLYQRTKLDRQIMERHDDQHEQYEDYSDSDEWDYGSHLHYDFHESNNHYDDQSDVAYYGGFTGEALK